MHKSASAQTPPAPSQYLVYIGTYTDKTSSKGIYAYRFDSATGKVEDLGLAAATEQPSFLTVDAAGKYLYAVNELDTYQGEPTGAISSFAINRSTGKLTLLNEIPSRGAAPAHITIDRTGKYALVSNYDGGSLAVSPILADGKLGDPTDVVQHHGSSVNPDRQAAAHVHEIVMSPDNRFAISTDLGLDQVFTYAFDSATGKLGRDPRILKVTPGSGPRHVAFAPNGQPDGQFVYLLSELSSTVSVLSRDSSTGAMAVLQTVHLAPEDIDPAKKWAAEIELSRTGKYLYASNRADNLLAVYSVNSKTGLIAPRQTVPLPNKTPRNFALDPTGRWLWDANQESDNIVLFRVSASSGRLSPSGQTVSIPSPVCVIFIPAQ